MTLDEARRLGPRQIREGSLLPVRDGFADRVFYGRVEHILVEELAATIPLVKELDFKESTSDMVVRRKMTANRFLPRG